MFKIIAFIIFSASASMAFAKTETPQQVTVGVNGMVCSFCAQGIEKKFMDTKKVQKIDVDLDNKKVSLQFKKGESLDEAAVKKIIKDAGYDVTTYSLEGPQS